MTQAVFEIDLARRLCQDMADAWLPSLAEQTGMHADQCLAQLGNALHCPSIPSAEYSHLSADLRIVPITQAQEWQMALIADPEKPAACWIGLLSNPFAGARMQAVQLRSDRPIQWRLAWPDELAAYLKAQEAQTQQLASLASIDAKGDVANTSSIEQLSLSSIRDSDSDAVRFVNATLYDALRLGASDIHIEATPQGLATRLRMDGSLGRPIVTPGVALASQAISRIKVLAQLDIAETRVPQDGSFRVAYSGRDIDLRVSVMPSTQGEDAVIRVLDKQSMVSSKGGLSLESLGYPELIREQLRALVKTPYGMVLVAGPTGSGKTTTLYAALSEVNHFSQKIITIEDPVEYQLEGVLQIPVNDKKGLSFARGLRSILRHDPDKIMVGEIRDKETAEIAVQSALTGHLVLSTVHANSSFEVFQRFTHMGIDMYNLVSALNGIVAQRLVRLLCKSCSRPAQAGDANLHSLQLLGLDESSLNLIRMPVGCTECRDTGYKGRTAVSEVLRLNSEIGEAVLNRSSPRVIRELAIASGTRTLLQATRDLALTGQTSLEEIGSVAIIVDK